MSNTVQVPADKLKEMQNRIAHLEAQVEAWETWSTRLAGRAVCDLYTTQAVDYVYLKDGTKLSFRMIRKPDIDALLQSEGKE